MRKTALNFDLGDSDTPKYQRMVERLEAGIDGGQWKVGDRLPSNREMAVLFGVTIGTVSKAMSEAVRRGIVETRVGSGTYIRERQSGPVYAGAAGGGMADLALNVLPVAPVQDLLKAAVAAHAQAKGAARLFAHVGTYQTGSFRRDAAAWLSEMGTPSEPDEVILTNGVHHALQAAFHTLLKPGEAALCDALAYTGFKRIAGLRGVRLVGVAGDSEGMRPDALDRALRESGAKVLVANPVFQNPTGTTMPLQRREQIAAICRAQDVRVIEDGVGVPLSDPGTPSLAALMPERAVHLAGFSKSIASGFRLGYARMPAGWLEAFQDGILAVQWFPPGYYAELVEVMRADGLLERCVQAQRNEAAARQQLLREYLPQAAPGAVGYHAWLPLSGERPSTQLCEQMRSEGVILSAGQHFAVDPAVPDGVRISLGSCEDRADLRRGLAVLSGVLESHSRYRVAAAPAV